MPQIPAAILLPAFGCAVGSALHPAIGGGALMSAANSANVANGFQSCVPSSWTSVCALARFSLNQRRTWSALIGPYCCPSMPMILYIATLFPVLPTAPRLCFRIPHLEQALNPRRLPLL